LCSSCILHIEFKAESGYIENHWKENPNGESYRSWMGKAGLGDLQIEQIERWSKVYAATAEKYGKEYGWDKESSVGDRDGRRRLQAGSIAPLEGAPSIRGFTGPDEKIVSTPYHLTPLVPFLIAPSLDLTGAEPPVLVYGT
jgi:hypothetical protein